MFYKKCPGQNAHNEINPVHLPSCAISRPKLPLSCYAPELFLKPKAINVFGERTNPQITQCALCRLASVRLWDNILHPATTQDKDTQGHLSPCHILWHIYDSSTKFIPFHSKFDHILFVNTKDFSFFL